MPHQCDCSVPYWLIKIRTTVECWHCREKSRDCISCCSSPVKNQTGKSPLRSSVDVDVVYVDPLSGDTVGDEKVTSVARAKCLRHRSLFIDPETISLPPQPLGAPVVHLGVERVVGLPVASVTFHRVCLSDRLARRLADVLLRHRSFRILAFVQCHRVEACLFRIRQTLVDRKCNSGSELSRLHVRLSHVDDVNVVAELAEVLSHSLHSLSLTGCSIMSTGCAAVVRSLVAGSRCLLELDLGFNDVTDVGTLSDALAANCSLRCLRLRGNAIGSAGAASLFGSLRRNYRLELLDISGNPIGELQKSSNDDLWRVVAEVLLCNRTLRELKLERCSLGVEACSALGRALAVNTTLRVLDVSMNQSVGDLGVALLANGLRRNRRSGICTLALNMCAVGNVGLRSLLVAIKDGGATGLRHVKLCYNRIGSNDQLQLVCRRVGPRPTISGRQSSTRPRPASAHFELRVQKASRLRPLPDRPGSGTLTWLISSDTKDSETVPSSTPMIRQGRSSANRRPLSSIVMSHNLYADTASENKPPMTSQNPTASDCEAHLANNGAKSDTTTLGAVFNQGNHQLALASTSTASQQRRTVVGGVCNSAAVEELSTLSEFPDVGRDISSCTEVVLSASSVFSTAEVDGGKMAPTRLDLSQIPTPTTNEDGDVEDNIYVLLCQVLRANPQLKVLLWGNQQWYSAGGAASRAIELDADIAEPVVSSLMDERKSNVLDCRRPAYATLPRNYDFASHFI